MTRQYARNATAAAATAAVMATSGAAPSQASNYVAAPSGAQSTDDTEIGQVPDRLMKSSGDASAALPSMDIAKVTDSPMDDDYVSNMAFMRENIDVRIGETDDPQADQVFEININGRAFFFTRGEVKTVPRYVVDHMLRMKKTTYGQKEVHNKEGVKDYVYPSRSSLKYPLMVVRDASPSSHAWFQFTSSLRG